MLAPDVSPEGRSFSEALTFSKDFSYELYGQKLVGGLQEYIRGMGPIKECAATLVQGSYGCAQRRSPHSTSIKIQS